MPKFVKLTVCAIVENKEEVEIVRNWIKKWKPEFEHFKSKGCGCCVIMYDVSAPKSAAAELPENLLAWSDWAKPEEFNKK